jgi:hypothetical protein
MRGLVAFSLAATLLTGTAIAQSNQPGTTAPQRTQAPVAPHQRQASPANDAQKGASDAQKDRNAASKDTNQAISTTDANAATPAKGANSFTQGQAQSRLEKAGFSNVTDLKKDDNGIWRGKAQKGSETADVWLDYKGNAGEQR